jgi:acyl-CoA thioesterase-1
MGLLVPLITLGMVGCSPPADTPEVESGPPGNSTAMTTRTAVRGDSVGADTLIRMVFLGTSLTAGLGLRLPEDRWPEQVGRLAGLSGYDVDVVNAGVSGDTSTGGLRRLGWVLEERVDVLVVELGANDGLRGQSPSNLEENLHAIVQTTRERWPEAQIVIVGMEAPRNLGDEYVSAFRVVFPRVAAATGSSLVPFLLDGVAAVPELNQADGIHPTAEGHQKMAETAWPYIEPLLRESAG